MKMRIVVFLALSLCVYAAEEAEKKSTDAETNIDKRQTHEGNHGHAHLIYRSAKMQDQVAPVMENQDDDKGSLRNRTSLQPISEDRGAKIDRLARQKPGKARSASYTSSSTEHNKIDEPSEMPNMAGSMSPMQLQNTPEVQIEHNGLNLEDRQKSLIPPPRDGKSYTPEEFTSLIVQGYAVTPVPDFGLDVEETKSFYGSLASTVSPPIQYTSSSFSPSPFTPTPYFSRDIPVTSTLAPNLLDDIGENQKNEQALDLDIEALKGRLDYQRSLPPPKNKKAYTLEEYNNLVAAGYPVTPVPVAPLSFDIAQPSQPDAEEYRPGQVFSLNPRELLELQPERKAPLASNQILQQLYANTQQDHKQNLQQIFFLEPQTQSGRQVPPSHAVIARPHFSLNGGEASVGAALSVSDNGGNSADSIDRELLALLGHASVRSQEPRPTQSTPIQSVAPQYQQVDRYISKPSKKSSKVRSKVQTTPQPSPAPQQYLIETTNVQQQQQQHQQPQYRPTPQPQRLPQSLRYVPIPQTAQEQNLYESVESQGLRIVPAPKLQQQSRAQFNYRLAPQYQQQQQEVTPKQYRLVELPRAQPIRQELRIPASSVERPLTFLKRYPELEKQRSVKIYDPIESLSNQQAAQLFGEQFVLRPVYRSNEQQRQRYELPLPIAKSEQPRVAESTKPPQSAIYVSKNLPNPRQQKARPQAQQSVKYEQASNVEQVNIEQHGQSLEEQRSHLPPPKNNKAYTPEEFAALVAAGYSVTPVPVSAANLDTAQSRASIETVTAQPKRRLTQRRRNQYLPVRDDAP